MVLFVKDHLFCNTPWLCTKQIMWINKNMYLHLGKISTSMLIIKGMFAYLYLFFMNWRFYVVFKACILLKFFKLLDFTVFFHKWLKDNWGWRNFAEMCGIDNLKINTNFRAIFLCTQLIFIHNKLIFICRTYSDGFSRRLTQYSLCFRNGFFYKTQIKFSFQKVKE
jgi:hypothetical protein